MDRWKSALALTVAGVMLAGTALAQSGGSGSSGGSGGGNTTTPQMGTTQPTPSGTNTSSGTSGSASGSATTGTKSGDMKSGDMKSGDMKSSTDMKSKSSGKMARSGGAEQVKAVQQALKDKGMDPGEVDGKMGPKTQSALRDYQKKEGLKESSRLDTETMAKLGVATPSDSSSSGAGAATGSGSSAVPSKQTR